MNYEEALKRVKIHNEHHSQKEPFSIYTTEALNMAIAALEKQIPKKVKIVEGYALCPICNHYIEDIDFISDNSHKYCDCCGQAIRQLDLSDTE